jgi:hypothetical protein
VATVAMIKTSSGTLLRRSAASFAWMNPRLPKTKAPADPPRWVEQELDRRCSRAPGPLARRAFGSH